MRQKAKLVWNVEGNSYCKKCHPVTERLISSWMARQSIDRGFQRISSIFFGGLCYSCAAVWKRTSLRPVQAESRHYAWYHNGYPSKAYSYCTKCHGISYKLLTSYSIYPALSRKIGVLHFTHN